MFGAPIPIALLYLFFSASQRAAPVVRRLFDLSRSDLAKEVQYRFASRRVFGGIRCMLAQDLAPLGFRVHGHRRQAETSR